MSVEIDDEALLGQHFQQGDEDAPIPENDLLSDDEDGIEDANESGLTPDAADRVLSRVTRVGRGGVKRKVDARWLTEFECFICPKEKKRPFRFKCDLDAHILSSHPGLNCAHCPVSKPNRQLLSVHMIKDHPELSLPPHLCVLCGYGTVTFCKFNQHWKKHAQARHQLKELSKADSKAGRAEDFQGSEPKTPKLTCGICQKLFKKKKTLSRHMKFVHSEDMYRCPYCKHGFPNEEFGIAHMLQRHPASDPDVLIKPINRRVQQKLEEEDLREGEIRRKALLEGGDDDYNEASFDDDDGLEIGEIE